MGARAVHRHGAAAPTPSFLDGRRGAPPPLWIALESGAEFGRRRCTTGTVVRVNSSHIVINCSGPRGGTFIERYSRRDGIRVGGLSRAELVNPGSAEPALTEARRRTAYIDVLYRDWTRNRADVDGLRRLYTAIREYLDEVQSGDEGASPS